MTAYYQEEHENLSFTAADQVRRDAGDKPVFDVVTLLVLEAAGANLETVL